MSPSYISSLSLGLNLAPNPWVQTCISKSYLTGPAANSLRPVPALPGAVPQFADVFQVRHGPGEHHSTSSQTLLR